MAKFRLGEQVKTRRPCVTIGTDHVVHPAGSECEVVALPGGNRVLPEWYQVKFYGDPNPAYALEWHLERIVGSWDEIERITGFRPSKPRHKSPEREPETVT